MPPSGAKVAVALLTVNEDATLPKATKAAVAPLTVWEDNKLPKAADTVIKDNLHTPAMPPIGAKNTITPANLLTFPFASIAVKPIGLTTSLSATAKTPPASSAQEQTSFKTPTNTASDTVLAEGFFEEDPENEKSHGP